MRDHKTIKTALGVLYSILVAFGLIGLLAFTVFAVRYAWTLGGLQ